MLATHHTDLESAAHHLPPPSPPTTTPPLLHTYPHPFHPSPPRTLSTCDYVARVSGTSAARIGDAQCGQQINKKTGGSFAVDWMFTSPARNAEDMKKKKVALHDTKNSCFLRSLAGTLHRSGHITISERTRSRESPHASSAMLGRWPKLSLTRRFHDDRLCGRGHRQRRDPSSLMD